MTHLTVAHQEDPEFANLSSGPLPNIESVESLVAEAHERYDSVAVGANSTVYPALERADPTGFGVALVTSAGRIIEAGDTATQFTIMSVAKPFVFALVSQHLGRSEARRRIGANATGRAFNALAPVELAEHGATNPMVNSGAIATTGLIPGDSLEERWVAIRDGLSAFAGRPLDLDDEVYESASATNHRNQAIARLLVAVGGLDGDPAETVDLYTRQSSLSVTARDLAVMGATLATGGVNPLTGVRAAPAETCHDVLAVMTTAGLYETSGDWLYEVGLPGKSGIGGGIVTVSPGKGGLGTYSTPLDEAGNSVRGQLTARFLSRRLGLDLFAATPPAVPDTLDPDTIDPDTIDPDTIDPDTAP